MLRIVLLVLHHPEVVPGRSAGLRRDGDLVPAVTVEVADDGELRGVVKVTHTTVNGRTYQNLEAFAPAAKWSELATDSLSFEQRDPEVA